METRNKLKHICQSNDLNRVIVGKGEVSSLYVLKTFGAIFVLLIHFALIYCQYLEPIYRLGVPIFFAIGGYFYYSKDVSKIKERSLKSLRKMMKLILFLNLVYAVLNYFMIDWKFNFTFEGIVRWITCGDNVSGHLWFLTSYAWTIVFLWLLHIFHLRKLIYPLAILLAIFGFVGGQYAFLFPSLSLNDYNYLIPNVMGGYSFFVLCFWMKEYETFIMSKLNKKNTLILLGIAIVMCYIEH